MRIWTIYLLRKWQSLKAVRSDTYRSEYLSRSWKQ
nr:MAG TPA: hypothetical protein [Caudoviricetes sp.]